jgi:hypothetical protein
VARLSWPEVCARRLGRHALAAPSAAARPADVVAAMCGAHAQVLSAAELSIGIRIPGIARAEIRDALWREHSLVKTYGPRGTVHLLPTRDLPMWTGALAAIPPVRNVHDRNELLTPDQRDAVVAAIGTALADADLTVDELTEAVVAIAGSWAGDLVMEAFQVKWPRWRWATSAAANRGALCFGPNRGAKVTYTSPHRWLPALRPLDGPTAHRELLKRYLHAYGPATPHHLAQWLNAPRRWAADLFDALAGELEPVEVDGYTGWVVAGDAAPPEEPPAGVRLLPYFDAYAVGSQPRELVFPGRAAARVLAGGQAGNFPVLLVDGLAAGVWHQRRAGKRIEITVEPFDELTPPQRAELDEQAARVAELLDGEPRLTIGSVAVGPHA